MINQNMKSTYEEKAACILQQTAAQVQKTA